MTTGNQQLQARGGKNNPNLLGILQAFSTGGFFLTQNELLVLEGDEDYVQAPGVFIGLSSVGELLSVTNNTGAGITCSLIFVDPEGSEIVTDGPTAIGSGSSATLQPLGFILAGEKYILRTVGNLQSGSGVHVTRGVSQMAPTGVQGSSSKVTNSTVELVADPGSMALEDGLIIYNFGTTSVTYDTYQVYADGYEEQVDSGQIIAPGAAGNTGGVVAPGITFKVVFNSLPAAGYLYAQRFKVFPSNCYNAQPEI